MQIDKKLEAEIRTFCKENGIKPVEYVNLLLRKAFTEDKFGFPTGGFSMPVYKDPSSGLDIIGKPGNEAEEENEVKITPIEVSDVIDADDIYGESVQKEIKPKKRALK